MLITRCTDENVFKSLPGAVAPMEPNTAQRAIKVSGLPLVLVLRADLTSGARTVKGVIATFGGPWETARRLPLKGALYAVSRSKKNRDLLRPDTPPEKVSHLVKVTDLGLSECLIYLFISFVAVAAAWWNLSLHCCFGFNIYVFVRYIISIGPCVEIMSAAKI